MPTKAKAVDEKQKVEDEATEVANRPETPSFKEEEMSDKATDPDEKREQRQKEWGTQFDKFLINCNQRKRFLAITTLNPIHGVTKDGNILEAGVDVVDREFVCFSTNETNRVWINKSQLVSVRMIGNRPNWQNSNSEGS
jgi:hypothetical protein